MMQNAALIYFKGSKQGIIAALGCLIAVMAGTSSSTASSRRRR